MIEGEAILRELASKAIEIGADGLEVEYNGGKEEVCAMNRSAGVGFGIASFPSNQPQAEALREELYRLAKKKQVVVLQGVRYEMRARIFDSFG